MDELLKEVKVNYHKTKAIEQALHTLRDVMDDMEDVSVTDLAEYSDWKLRNPEAVLPFKFSKPTRVDIVGSFLVHTGETL